MYSCGVKMIWIFLVLSQLHFMYSFPIETAKNIEIAAPSFPDLELIEPSADFSPDLEKGNEKIHKIVDSYRAIQSDVAAQSNVSDQSRQMVIIDHVSPSQRPPYGRPPLPPTVVEVFQPSSPPAHPPGRPIPFPPSRPGSPHRPQYPPFRPGLPPHRPGLDLPNVPLPPDVEVFNQPSPNVPPDVEVFNPSDGRPITFPAIADIQVPFDKNAIENQVGANDSGVISSLSSILGTPEQSQSYLGDFSWNATKASAAYKQLQRFLEVSLPEQKNVSGNAITESPVDSSTVSKESHTVRMNQNPPKREDKSSDDAINVNLPSKTTYPSAKPTVMEERDEYEMLQSTRREASNEVNPPNENAAPETWTIKGAEPSPDDNLEVKKLIDHLLVEKTVANEAAADKSDKLDPTEFSVPQKTTTEKMFLANESTKVENVSTEDSSTESSNSTESKMLPNSTYQISEEISKDPISPSIPKPMSPQEYKELCRLLAKYVLNKMQISSAGSEIMSSDEEFEYILPVMPSTYEEPLVTGRNADDNEELASLLDSVDLALPESSTNSFDRSVLPDGSANEANSGLYLVSQPENMEFANSYLSPPGEMIVPYKFEGYA